MASNGAGRDSARDREMGSQKFSSLVEQHLERIALEFRSQESERDTTMKTKAKNTGIKVTASVKAGGLNSNHNAAGLKIRSGVKAGSTTELRQNHSARMIVVQ